MPDPSAAPAAVDVTLEGDALDELGLLTDGLLNDGRYGHGPVPPLRLPAHLDVEVGTTLRLRDPDGTHLADAEALMVTGHGVVTGRLAVHRPPRTIGFPDLFPSREQVTAALEGAGRATVLAWQPRTPPPAQAIAEVVDRVREREAALLFQPLVVADHDRLRAATLRALRLVRDRLQAAPVPVVTRALPGVVADRGYGVTVAQGCGADDRLEVPLDGPLDDEVAAALATGRPSPQQAGIVVLLTGLSGSGKSTIALELYARLLEDGSRTVTLLDGDLVRRSLSSELTFSKEHRDLNVRRIGYVASEIAKHGGIAICCPIAPYDEVRQDVRRMVDEVDGRYVLVHVSTPLEVCEQRDVKGLYAAARAGEIANFTGISDPYEVPTDADLTIDTAHVPVDQAADRVLTLLREETRLR